MNEQYSDDIREIDVFPSGKSFRVLFDSQMNTLRLIAKSRDNLDEIRKVFSVENKAAFFSKQYGFRGEDRKYNVNKFGYFRSGLFFKIMDWIKTQYGSLDCVAISKKCAQYITDFLTPMKGRITDDRTIYNIADDSGRNARSKNNLQLRDYQRNAIEMLIFKNYGRGLIELPTSSGKSFVIANFIYNLQKRTFGQMKFMIFVPNVQLVEQFYGDLLDYGYEKNDLAKFEGGMSKKDKAENDVNKAKIIIANRQYAFKNPKLLPHIDAVIADECHSMVAQSSAEFIDQLNAKIKIGCSGTLPTDKYLQNELIGMFGSVAYSENITDLQDRGYITRIKIVSIGIVDQTVENDRNLLFNVKSLKKYNADDPANSEIKFDDAIHAEHDYIAKWYKELYKPVLDYVENLEGNTLILFDKLDVGYDLYKYYVGLHPDNQKIYYNDGQTDVNEREKTRALLEQSDGNILFANVQILSTGINIKRLHNLVFCFSSKSTTRIIQSCGRALRLHPGKTHALLVDCHFNFKYSKRHYDERLKLYQDYYKKKPDECITVNI